MMTIDTRKIVHDHAGELAPMTTHGELYRFARANGITSRAAFSWFKKRLLEIGVDYDALRERGR